MEDRERMSLNQINKVYAEKYIWLLVTALHFKSSSKVQVISLYWFAVLHQTSIFRSQKYDLFT